MKIMGIISALFATAMLIFAFEFLGKDFFHFDKGGLYAWSVLICLTTLTVSGWRYVRVGKLLSGIIHLVLMSGVAGVSLIWGFLTFNIGTGPTSPVGPSIRLVGLAALIFGFIAAICAAGVVCRLFRSPKK
jgi:hypothetical protein